MITAVPNATAHFTVGGNEMRSWGLAASAWALATSAAHAETHIADSLRFRLVSDVVTVAPGKASIIPLHLDRGDVLEVSVALSDDSISGIGAVVCPKSELEHYIQGIAAPNCRGFAKESAGGEFYFEVFFSGDYVLAIDNTFANFFKKEASYSLTLNTRPDAETITALKRAFDETYRELKAGFVFADFDLTVSPCGQQNAFSENANGNITVCSELLFEAGRQIDKDVIAGVLLHELGHTLLNLWGLPNFQNEQTADEFATVLMVLSGETQAAEHYLAYFEGVDPVDEAVAATLGDSPHPLSIQRMRNIGRILDDPKPYIKRWLPTLYRNMTKDALRGETESPNAFSDAELARRILAER